MQANDWYILSAPLPRAAGRSGLMRPIEAPPGTALDLSKADTLLFVVDTVNAAPGSVGEISFTDIRWLGPSR